MTYFSFIQGDQKVSVHLMITIQSSGAQILFDRLYLLCAVEVISTNLLVIFEFNNFWIISVDEFFYNSSIRISVWENEISCNTERRTCLYFYKLLNSWEGCMKKEHITGTRFATFKLLLPLIPWNGHTLFIFIWNFLLLKFPFSQLLNTSVVHYQ